MSLCIVGRVRTGLGHGRRVHQPPWVRRQFMHTLGIDPFPGTLNLHLAPAAMSALAVAHREVPASGWYRSSRRTVRRVATRCGPRSPGVARSRQPSSCPRFPATRRTRSRCVASVSLREVLGLADGDVVTPRHRSGAEPPGGALRCRWNARQLHRWLPSGRGKGSAALWLVGVAGGRVPGDELRRPVLGSGGSSRVAWRRGTHRAAAP